MAKASLYIKYLPKRVGFVFRLIKWRLAIIKSKLYKDWA